MNIYRKINANYNLLPFFFCYMKKSVKLPYPPFFFWVEPTNACNLKCISCPQSIEQNKRVKKGFMSFNLYQRLIDEIKTLNPKAITLHLGGEPLLHPDLFRMIELAKREHLFVLFSSNGTLLTKKKAEALIDSGLNALRIDFSPEKSLFERIRKGAQWEHVLNNITMLLELKRSRKSIFPLVTLVNLSADDPGSLSRLKEIFRGLPVHEISNFKAHTWAGKFADLSMDGFLWSISRESYYPCSHAWSGLAIRWNGKVVPCCRDLQGDYIVGDANKSSLLEVWNSRKFIALRQKLRDGDFAEIALCRNCSKLWEGKPYHVILKAASHLWKNFRLRLFPKI